MKRITLRVAAAHLAAIKKQPGLIKKGFDVRIAAPADIPDLLESGRACFAYNPPTRRELHYALTRGHMVIVVLFVERTEEMAGFDIYELNRRNRSLYLSLTCLKPAFRGRGLSRGLLGVCHEMAVRAGCRSIRSHVAEGNAAMIHLLESSGHERGERHKAYYSDGKAAITYRLDLRKR